MVRCEDSGFPACSHPTEVCYETLLLPYLSLRTESGVFRGALDRYFRSCGASLMMPWEGDEIRSPKYELPNSLIVALSLLRKSLLPSSTRVLGLPSYETILRSIIFPFDLCLYRSGQVHSSLYTGKPASPSMVLCIMRACSCGELRPPVGVTGRMKRVRCHPEVGTLGGYVLPGNSRRSRSGYTLVHSNRQ